MQSCSCRSCITTALVTWRGGKRRGVCGSCRKRFPIRNPLECPSGNWNGLLTSDSITQACSGEGTASRPSKYSVSTLECVLFGNPIVANRCLWMYPFATYMDVFVFLRLLTPSHIVYGMVGHLTSSAILLLGTYLSNDVLRTKPG